MTAHRREETAWIPFVRMWEESGYEIYEGMTTTYSTVEVYNQIEAPARERLEVFFLYFLTRNYTKNNVIGT